MLLIARLLMRSIKHVVIILLLSCIGAIVIAVLLMGLGKRHWLTHTILTDYQTLLPLLPVQQKKLLQHGWQAIPAQWQLPTHLPKFMPTTVLQTIITGGLLGIKQLITRLLVLLSASKLVVYLGIVVLTDGFTQRAIRRVNGCRESALIYHHLQALMTLCFSVSVLLILLWPWPLVTIRNEVLLTLISFAFFLQRSATFFKQYW